MTKSNISCDVVFCTHFFFVTTNKHIALLVIPSRNAMTPPQLARDTPVLNITHPREVHVLVLFWYELNIAIFYRFNRWFRQNTCANVPLVSQHWLNYHATTVAVRNR
ncbi:Uncharacterised protein [Vibrio cholerae]|nr:Uncharacterised protein [Vibrio cholerae]